MGSKSTTTYMVNGVEKSFYFPIFMARFEEKSKELEGRRNITEYEEMLAKAVGVGQATVHSWRNQKSAPGDLQLVGSIAEFLGLEQEDLLFAKREDKMNKLDAQQREALARIYRDLEDYLFLIDSSILEFKGNFQISDGSVYANYYPVFCDLGGKVSRETSLNEGLVVKACGLNWVKHSIAREWVMLGSHPIYAELEQFMNDVMMIVMGDKGFDIGDGFKICGVDVDRLIKAAREIVSQYL